MSDNNSLQSVDERGWRSGFANLLRKENDQWWRARTWWIQSLIWLLILNGPVAFSLWGPSLHPRAASVSTLGYTESVLFFMSYKNVLIAIGAIILTQGVIIGEKQSGTAAWILSKPVSRSAFILSKLIANIVGMLATMIVLQDLIAYFQIALHGRSFPPLVPYLAATSLQSLNLLFYFTLTLALGTLFNSRAPVSGIPLVAVFTLPLLWNFIPWLHWLLPSGLSDLALRLMQGQPLPWFLPISIMATLLWSVLFVAMAIWRFRHEEF